MTWTNERVLEFIESYRRQPCIWDPMNHDHKNRSAVALAWQRVHETLNFYCSVNELKKKKESLMATYRMLLKKKKRHLNSDRRDEPFETHWFAHEAMEKFLGPVYLHRDADKTENMTIEEREIYDDDDETELYDETNFKIEDLNSIDDTIDTNDDSHEQIKDKATSNFFTFPKIPKQIDPEVCIHQSYHPRKDYLKEKRKLANDETDECSLYGQLLAKKLRKFSEDQREEIMFEIDGLIIQKRKSSMKQTLDLSKFASVSDGINSPRSTTTSSEYASMEGTT